MTATIVLLLASVALTVLWSTYPYWPRWRDFGEFLGIPVYIAWCVTIAAFLEWRAT